MAGITLGDLTIFMVLSFLVAFGNAKASGVAWEESRALGGWIRFIVWCAAIQSAIGFSLAYMLLFLLVSDQLGYLLPWVVHALLDLWYVMVVPLALGTGFMIMVQSCMVFLRERSLLAFA